MRVNIVLDKENEAWIIEKMASRLCEHARSHGVTVKVSSSPDSTAQLNHWMSYAFARERHVTPTTMFITHVDDPFKTALIKNELANGVDLGICMSGHAVADLVRHRVPEESLCFVLPGHDSMVTPRRIVIGLTTRVYPDRRKREAFLVRLAAAMPLNAFEFWIFGAGWESVVPHLLKAGAVVNYHPGSADFRADYAAILNAIPNFDYYLYMGLDEGSLGTLDALAAGIRTIVTPQGFHLDLSDSITHMFWTFEELLAVFRGIEQERQGRLDAASRLTWSEYARWHVLIWQAVCDGKKSELKSMIARTVGAGSRMHPQFRPGAEDLAYKLRALNPLRVRSAISHLSVFKSLRRWLRS